MAVESKNILEFYKSFSVMRSCDGAKKGDIFFVCSFPSEGRIVWEILLRLPVTGKTVIETGF